MRTNQLIKFNQIKESIKLIQIRKNQIKKIQNFFSIRKIKIQIQIKRYKNGTNKRNSLNK